MVQIRQYGYKFAIRSTCQLTIILHHLHLLGDKITHNTSPIWYSIILPNITQGGEFRYICGGEFVPSSSAKNIFYNIYLIFILKLYCGILLLPQLCNRGKRGITDRPAFSRDNCIRGILGIFEGSGHPE